MPLVKNLLLGGLTTLAAGGTGAGVWMIVQGSNATQSENTKIQTGIVVGPDAEETDEPKDQIRKAGLNCGDATTEKDCNIGSTGLNVDISNSKKEGLFPVEGENGNIRFRLSATEDQTYSNGYRFTVTGKPIKLQKKDKPNETITLEKYENYGLVKDATTSKVYLTRKLTADQWMKKSLGLPETCTIPTTVSTEPFDYKNPTCEPSNTEIQNINFDGKKDGGATTDGNVKLYIKKVNDTKTFKGGYKFTFHPFNDVEISSGNKLPKDVWWDFRIKEPDADDLVLERIWKNTEELLKEVGLSCPNGDSNACTITEGSLKIKVDKTSMEDGKKKVDGGTGTLKLERNRAGHYEGLRFSVQDGGITIVSNSSPETTVKMEEMEIFHIRKEDSNDSSYYLTRKHDLEEMIFFYLGLNKNGCTLPKDGNNTTCSVQGSTENNPLGKIKFHDGGEQTITNNTSSKLSITIAKGEEKTYPFGYKFSIKTESGEIKVGNITLTNTSATDFKIKKESGNSGPKLYLEKVN